MSIPSKNSNLAMFAAIAVSTILLSAVIKADANPYMQGDTIIAEKDTSSTVKKTTTVKPAAVNAKKKIQSVEGTQQGKPTGIDRGSKETFPREAPPTFVKSGKPADLDRKVLPQSGAKSQPSAVDVEKKIKSSTDN